MRGGKTLGSVEWLLINQWLWYFAGGPQFGRLRINWEVSCVALTQPSLRIRRLATVLIVLSFADCPSDSVYSFGVCHRSSPRSPKQISLIQLPLAQSASASHSAAAGLSLSFSLSESWECASEAAPKSNLDFEESDIPFQDLLARTLQCLCAPR